MNGLWDIQRQTGHGPQTDGQGRLLRTPSGEPGVQNDQKLFLEKEVINKPYDQDFMDMVVTMDTLSKPEVSKTTQIYSVEHFDLSFTTL